MCGIFGQITNDVTKIDNVSIKMLGIFNESRGKQSCGVFIDNEIKYGLNKLSLFSDFALFNNFNPINVPIVIGHTRQSSVGAINHHNAHPFGFDYTEKGFRYAGVHNGTLSNHEELAKKYDIDVFSKTYLETGSFTMRTKNDSELLLEILITTKNYNILSEYIGRAALCWIDTQENTTYLWSGKSNASSYSRILEEERPLNVYLKEKNNFFISSITEPLFMIGGNEENIFQIEYNTLYIIKNADFLNAEKIEISRENSLIKDFGSYSNTYQNKHTYGYGWDTYDDWDYLPANKTTSKTEIVSDLPTSILNDTKSSNSYDIYQEKLRFWQDNKLLTGCCIWISSYGYYKMTEDIVEFDYLLSNLKDYHFSYVTKDFIKSENLTSTVNTIKLITPSTAYFVEGVKMLTVTDYKYTKALMIPGRHIPYEKLSHVSDVPVVNIAKRKLNVNKQRILKAGEPYTGTYSGLGFYKSYLIKNGNFIKVTSVIQPTHFKIVSTNTFTVIEDKVKTITDADIFIKTSEFLDKYLLDNEIDKTDNSLSLVKFAQEYNEVIDDCTSAVKQLKEGLGVYKSEEIMEYDIVLDEISEMLEAYRQIV